MSNKAKKFNAKLRVN